MRFHPLILNLPFVLAFGSSAALQAAPDAQEKTPAQPNFLFIAVDDLNTCVGYLANEPGNLLGTLFPDPDRRNAFAASLTPNLNRLASESRVFSRSFTASPLCGPSRTALLTGVPTHRSGYYQHSESFRDYPNLREVTTLPQYLRQNGYFTAGVGKIFHKPRREFRGDRVIDWPDSTLSWDSFVFRQHGVQRHPDDVAPRYSLPWDTYIHYGRTLTQTEVAADYVNVSHIARLLGEGRSTLMDDEGIVREVTLPTDQPFFLAAGIFQPHLPWKTPTEFFDRVPIEDLQVTRELMDSWLADLDDVPEAGREWTTASPTGGNEYRRFLDRAVAMDGAGADLQTLREMIQAYLACVAFADHCIGALIDALNSGPHAADTVVILWSDHGYHLGEKSRMGKTALWDEADRNVLLIRDPQIGANDGRFCRSAVSLQDLYPTVVARAGLPLPIQVSGEDLAPLLQDPQARRREPVLTTWLRGNHAVRDDRWCLIHYVNGTEEFYDDLNDPDQHLNLVARSDYAEEIARLRNSLPDYDSVSMVPGEE
ncbi:MAG: sulfatase [Opitutaceae bacterium]